MRKYFLLFYLAIQSTLCCAQVREISGLVTFNNQRVSGADIKNISNHTQTMSNERGEFTINAKSGDTLTAAKTDFAKDTIILTDQQYVMVQLHKLPFMLNTVVINGKAITPESALAENKQEYKDIYRKGDKGHMISIPLFLMGAGLALSIDKLYSALSKEGKDARRLQHTLTRDYKNSIVDKRFNHLAALITGYKGKKLDDFIMYNRPSYEMVVKAADYDIVQYIKAKLKEGKKG